MDIILRQFQLNLRPHNLFTLNVILILTVLCLFVGL